MHTSFAFYNAVLVLKKTTCLCQEEKNRKEKEKQLIIAVIFSAIKKIGAQLEI